MPQEGHIIPIEQTAPGVTTLHPPDDSWRHSLYGIYLVLGKTGTIRFLSNTTPLTGVMPIEKGVPFTIPRGVGSHLSGKPGEALTLETTGGSAHGWIFLLTEP